MSSDYKRIQHFLKIILAATWKLPIRRKTKTIKKLYKYVDIKSFQNVFKTKNGTNERVVKKK